MRFKVAFRFATDGDVRFISHHDMMRMFERALARSGLPVKFTEGFNPRPKLSLPLPRPVGIASAADLLVVEFSHRMEPEAALARLAREMPAGVTLAEVRVIEGKKSPQPRRADFMVALGSETGAEARSALRRLLEASTWPIQRVTAGGKPGKVFDLRPAILDASVDDGVLHWSYAVSEKGSARPAEMLTALGLDPAQWHHRVRRVNVEWDYLDASEPERRANDAN